MRSSVRSRLAPPIFSITFISQLAAPRPLFSRARISVAFGLYATVLFVMGLTDRLADLVDPKNDSVGLQLEEERLPQRIRTPRKQKPPGR
jgi:hypothetical protein